MSMGKDDKQPKKILVVDDDPWVLRLLEKTLKGAHGYEVITALESRLGFEKAKEETPDLIVLDMIMSPGINGRETYERILETHPNQKAIIASGFSETENVKETQRLGAGRYIKKPYTIEKIGIAIKEALQK